MCFLSPYGRPASQSSQSFPPSYPRRATGQSNLTPTLSPRSNLAEVSDVTESGMLLSITDVQQAPQSQVRERQVLLPRVRTPSQGEPSAVHLGLSVPVPERPHKLIAVPAISIVSHDWACSYAGSTNDRRNARTLSAQSHQPLRRRSKETRQQDPRTGAERSPPEFFTHLIRSSKFVVPMDRIGHLFR